MNAQIIDTETTGLADPIQVISFAAAAMDIDDEGKLVVGPIHEQFLKPSKLIEWGAMATHGILMSDLQDAPCYTTCQLPLNTTAIVGHNIDYDWKALGKPNVKRICTLAMARAAWPSLDSHKLASLMYYIHGPTPHTRDKLKDAHGAGVDVGLVAEILPTLLAEFEVTDLASLHTASEEARLPKIMTFGKYKGQPLSAVDGGWISWYRRQDDPDEYLLAAFRRLGK